MSKDTFPPISFHAAAVGGCRPLDRRTLASPLPLSRPSGTPPASHGVTYGIYLDAIERMVRDHWDRFTETLAKVSEGSRCEVRRIEIVTEKHGSDYHPARIRALTEDGARQFVVNVAVTERGKERIEKEFGLLRRLGEEFPEKFVPRVHFSAAVPVSTADGSSVALIMFLGEWLEGYSEFHLSGSESEGTLGTVLWDTDRGYGPLVDGEAEEIFRKAARILTYYYDSETFREIFPWHHASGDFVAGRFENGIDVKLITARQYAPRMDFADRSPDDPVTALFFFLANLTVRMRLDRLDGVGDTAWAGPHAVEGAVAGFLSGLGTQARQGLCRAALPREFSRAARNTDPGDLTEIFKIILESYHEDAPDLPVATRHLPDHILQVYGLLRDLPAFE